MIQAVILAGGKGTRLRPLTHDIPKPMIEINGRPFLEWQLELLKECGITNILILAGFLGSRIENYFKEGGRLGLDINYSYEKALLGTGGALKNAEHLIAREFLLLNGDTYLPIDYSKLVHYFREKKKTGVIVTYDNNSGKIPSSNINIDRNNYIIDYNKGGSSQLKLVDAGVAVYQKEVLSLVPRQKVVSLEQEIFPQLIKKRELLAYPTTQLFYDMGTRNGLKILKAYLMRN